MDWNAWIKQQRVDREMTLRDVATRMAIPEFQGITLSDVERGYRKFRTAELTRWAEVLQVDPSSVGIPLANAASERARNAAKQNRKNYGSDTNRAYLIEQAIKIIQNPHLTQSQAELIILNMRNYASSLLGL